MSKRGVFAEHMALFCEGWDHIRWPRECENVHNLDHNMRNLMSGSLVWLAVALAQD